MIPREIHQLWIKPACADCSVPDDVAAQTAAWKATHPDFVHRLWSLDDILQSLPNDDAAVLSDRLRACCFEAMQADLARLYLLHHRGGFWVDLRLRPLRSFLGDYCQGDLLLVEHFASEFIPQPAEVFINSLFGCRQGDPFIRQCLQRASRNVAQRMSSTVWEVTGPKVLMDTRDALMARGLDIGATILPSAQVWGRLVQIGSGSYANGPRHWSAREQNKPMYVDCETYADRVPVWRTKYLS